MEAFITSNSFDLVCLSETFLDSTIPNDDVNIQVNGYSLLRVDHPNDIKRGGVSISKVFLYRYLSLEEII